MSRMFGDNKILQENQIVVMIRKRHKHYSYSWLMPKAKHKRLMSVTYKDYLPPKYPRILHRMPRKWAAIIGESVWVTLTYLP